MIFRNLRFDFGFFFFRELSNIHFVPERTPKRNVCLRFVGRAGIIGYVRARRQVRDRRAKKRRFLPLFQNPQYCFRGFSAIVYVKKIPLFVYLNYVRGIACIKLKGLLLFIENNCHIIPFASCAYLIKQVAFRFILLCEYILFSKKYYTLNPYECQPPFLIFFLKNQ